MSDDQDVDVAKLPGIKEAELLALGRCAICRKRLLEPESPNLTFYRITISHAVLVPGALDRRVGLSLLVGNDAIARVMSPDEDLAKITSGPVSVLVHESCAGDVAHLGIFIEVAAEKERAGDAQPGSAPHA